VQRIKQIWPIVRNVSILLIVFSGGLIVASPTSALSSIPQPDLVPFITASTESLQTVAIGPLEFQFDGKKRSCVLLTLLALALYLPGLVSWIASSIHRKNTNEYPATAQQLASASNNATFHVNQQFNLPHIEASMGTEAEFFNEGVHIGSRYSFAVVAHQMVSKIRTEARSLMAGFSEEEHAIRYRKSKLIRLTEFCSTLEAALEEQWFLQACEVYKGSFGEKHFTVKQSLGKLANQRMELFLLAGKYDRLTADANTQKQIDAEYEQQFKMIYDNLIDELVSLCDALLTLNTRCAAEFSQTSVTQALCDATSKIVARRKS
jgi:hypothetical protein